MIKEDVAKLEPGLYRLWWKESRGGGNSLASVGVTKSGGRWMAPVNWVAPTTDAIQWRSVEEAEMLVPCATVNDVVQACAKLCDALDSDPDHLHPCDCAEAIRSM